MAKDNSVFVISTIPKLGLVSILMQNKEEADILGHRLIEQGSKDVHLYSYPMPREYEETALHIDPTTNPHFYRTVVEPLVRNHRKEVVTTLRKARGGRTDMKSGKPTRLPKLTIEKIKQIKQTLLENNQPKTAMLCGVSVGIVNKIANNKYMYRDISKI